MKKNIFLKELGHNITRIRQEKGISMDELGRLTGKKYLSIYRVEKGNVTPSLIYLCAIAEGLGTDISTIVKGLP